MNEQLVRERLRERASGAPDGPADLGRLWDQAQGRRRRRNSWLAAGGAAAAVAVVMTAAAVFRIGSPSPTTPVATSTSATDGSPAVGHSVLTPQMLQTRGRDLAEVLGLRDLASKDAGGCSDEPGASFVEYADYRGYCVAVGNAPDNWLASFLIWNQYSLEGRFLEQAGVPWTEALPPPPPVALELLRARVAELEGRGASAGDPAEQSLFSAKLALDQLHDLWVEDRPSWEAAGWNEHYWGDPWWPQY
jgi:hypothetical protein